MRMRRLPAPRAERATHALMIGVLALSAACQRTATNKLATTDDVTASSTRIEPAQTSPAASVASPPRTDSARGLQRPSARSDSLPKSGPERSTNGTRTAEVRRHSPRPELTDTLTVSAFLEQQLDAARHVVVKGACLDQFHARGSAGPPPVARSDWQLIGNEKVIYVVGPQPGECSFGPVAIAGTVGVDTVTVFGKRQQRRYLLRTRE